jgi:hypothetical protein
MGRFILAVRKALKLRVASRRLLSVSAKPEKNEVDEPNEVVGDDNVERQIAEAIKRVENRKWYENARAWWKRRK